MASLVHRPKILFLDEPTIGLDPTTKRILWDLIRDLNDNGHTIILCSHDMHEVDMLCDNVGIINTGNLVAYDTPQGLKDSLLENNRKVTNALSELPKGNNLALRKVSFLLENRNEIVFNVLKASPDVKSIEVEKNNRINIRIDSFDDNAISRILKSVLDAGGVIKSIASEEPSLEDVFIKATSEVDEDARA